MKVTVEVSWWFCEKNFTTDRYKDLNFGYSPWPLLSYFKANKSMTFYSPGKHIAKMNQYQINIYNVLANIDSKTINKYNKDMYKILLKNLIAFSITL